MSHLTFDYHTGFIICVLLVIVVMEILYEFPHTYPLYNCYMTYVRKEIRPYYFRGKIVVAKLGEDGVIRILTKEGEFRESSLLKLKECRKFKTAKQAMVYIIEYVKPNENQQNDKGE